MNSLMLATAVFIVDGEIKADQFRAQRAVKKAVVQFLETAPKELKNFLSETGFRPLKDLDQVRFRMTQPVNLDVPPEPLVTLKGRFKPKRIHSSWAKNKDSTAIKRTKIAGKTAYVGGANSPMFAIESPGVIHAGYRSTVEKALKGQLDPLRKLPPFLRGAKAWLRVRSTSQARRAIMQQKQGSPLAEIHEMQVKGWLEGEVLKLKMRLRTRHPDAANGIKLMVSLGLMNSNHPSSMKLGQALSYRVQGSMLSMDFSMKLRELMALRPPPPPPPGRGGPRVIREQPKDDRAMPGAGSGSMPPPAQGGPGGPGYSPQGLPPVRR